MAGQLVHFEIPAGDSSRAKEFYSAVFGWEFGPAYGDADYHMTRTGEQQGGAVSGLGGEKGHLTVYFDTDDIDATIAKIRESGGKADDKQPIPSIGWFAGATDSEGNAFSVYQTDESAPAPG